MDKDVDRFISLTVDLMDQLSAEVAGMRHHYKRSWNRLLKEYAAAQGISKEEASKRLTILFDGGEPA